MQCPKCGKNISGSAKFCGFCGKKFSQGANTEIVKQDTSLMPSQSATALSARLEQQQDNVARCPQCGSSSLQAMKKGASVGQAAVGAFLLGPIGLLAGGIGSNKTKVVCISCGFNAFID